MAQNYRIDVIGDERAIRVVGDKADKIPVALRVASELAAEVIEDSVKDHAPEPHSRTEVQGHGIFTEVKRRFRLAGRAAGGLLATRQTFTIAVVVEDPSVAAFVEWGTGIYAAPARGGPHSAYDIKVGKGKKALGPLFAGGGDIFRQKVHIEGTHPRPFIAVGVEAVHREVDAIYEGAIREAL